MSTNVVIGSFDIGLQNFAIYIESIPYSTLKELQIEYTTIPKHYQTFLLNKHTHNIITKLTACGTIIYTSVDALCPKNTKYSNNVRLCVIKHLESMQDLLSLCNVFVIEQQYAKRGSSNFTAIKTAEVTATYLQTRCKGVVIDFPSRFKTLCFGSEAKTKQERKAFTVHYAEEIFLLRKDEDKNNEYLHTLFELSRNIKRKRKDREQYLDLFVKAPPFIRQLANKVIMGRQKLCDVSDALAQCQAFKFKNLIANIN